MYNPDRVELVRRRLGLTKIGFAEQLGIDRKSFNVLSVENTISLRTLWHNY